MDYGETLETAVWVAHAPADVARLFRCLCSVARRFELPVGRFGAGDRVLTSS